MAGRHNFTIDQGRTWRRWIILWQDRAKTIPLPMIGFTASLVIRKRCDDAAPAIELTTENGKITITANAGKVSWVLTDAETEALEAQLVDDEYIYELVIRNTEGESIAVLKGKITVSPDVEV